MRFRQYIPVKAGGSNPDPAVYCPANGYYLLEEEGQWEPPYTIPDAETESIVLVFQNEANIAFRAQILTNLATYFYHIEVKTIEGVVLDEFDVTQTNIIFEYPSFPYSDSDFLILTITPQPGHTIKDFRLSPNIDIPADLINVVEARFFTPSIVYLAYAFLEIQSIRKVSFLAEMQNLENFYGFFMNSGIQHFRFPPFVFPSTMTDLKYFFQNSKIKTIDFNNAKFPFVTLLDYFIKDCYDFVAFKNFNPGEMPLTSMLGFAINAFSWAEDVDLSAMIVTSSSVNIGGAFDNTSLKSLKMFTPSGAITYSNTNLVNGSSLLKKVDYNADDLTVTGNTLIGTAINLFEIIPPKILRTNYNNVLIKTATRISELILPDYLFGSGDISGTSILSKITNTPVCDDNLHSVSILSSVLDAFEIPTMSIRTISIGVSGGALNSVVVDWANSFTHSYTATTLLVNLRGSLSTLAIDTIFSALPTIAGGRIDVRYNPGYATCDATIATAKGWTVL